MSERENIRHAADMLAGYAATCRMSNTLEWMAGLTKAINAYLEATGDGDRVTSFGYGLQTITAQEISTLDSFGYPTQ